MKPEIMFVANRAQFESCRALFSEERIPAMYDHDLLLEMELAGLPHVNLWMYHDESSAVANDDAAWAFGDHLAAFHVGEPGGLAGKVVERCADEFVHPVRFALNTKTVVERCLADVRPETAWVFEDCRTAFVWDPPDPPPDLFNAVARWCAGRAGCSLQLLSLRSAAPIHPPAEVRPQTAFRLPREIQVVSWAQWLGVAERGVLLDHPELTQMGVVHFFDRASAPHIGTRTILDLPFRSQPFGASCAEGLRAHLKKAGETYACLTDNPCASFLLEYVLNRFEAGSRWYFMGRFLARSTGAKAALLDYPVPALARCLREGFAERGCATLAINHSGLIAPFSWRRHRRNRGDVCVWGEWEKALLARQRGRDEGIHICGSLRKDMGIAARKEPPAPCRAPPRIVLITGRITHLYVSGADVRQHWQSWDEILDIAARHPEWNFVIKPHPRFDHANHYRSPRFQAVPNLSVMDGTIAEALEGAAVAVSVNSTTSGCLDPMALGVPLVSVERALYERHRGMLEEGALAVRSAAELEEVLERFVTDGAAREAQCERGRCYLRRMLAASGEEAARTALTMIREKVAAATPLAKSPAAAWVLELAVAAHNALSADGLPDWKREFRRLRQEARNLDFRVMEDVHPLELGRYFMEMATSDRWATGSSGRPVSARQVLWQVHRALPAHIRPPAKTLLRCWRRAGVLDSRRRESLRHTLPETDVGSRAGAVP